MADIGTALATMLGGNYVNLFNLQGRSYQVIPQAPRAFRLIPEWLTRYQLRTSNGELAPLSAVASVTEKVQPNALTSFQQLNSATLSGCRSRQHAGRGARLPEGEVRGSLSRGLFLRFPGQFASARAGRQRARLRLRLRADRHLSRAVGAVRELPRSVHHPGGAADGAVRRAAAAQRRRRHGLRHDQHLFADRPGDADRPDRQARHPDGRLRQQSTGDARPLAARRDVEAASIRLRPT